MHLGAHTTSTYFQFRIVAPMVTDLSLLFHAYHSIWGRTQLQRTKFRSEFINFDDV